MSTTFDFIKYLLSYLKKFLKYTFLSLFFATIVSLLTGLGTWSIKPIFDYVLIEKNYSYAKFIPFYIFFLYFFIGLFSLLQAYFSKALSSSIVNSIRETLFSKTLRLNYSTFILSSSSQKLSKIINDTAQIEPILGETIQIFIKESLTVIALISVAFYLRWDLTLLVMISLPIIAYETYVLGKKVKRNKKLSQESTGELTERVKEILLGIKEIKFLGNFEKLTNYFKRELSRYFILSLKVTKYREASRSIVDLMTGIVSAIILGYGSYLIIQGKMTPGTFLSVLTSILLIFNPLRKLARAYTQLKEAHGAWLRIEELLSLEEERGGVLKAQPPKKGFVFEGVSFSYPGSERLVLKEINLNLPAGKLIAVVGPSGAGKSTLLSLLARLYDPNEGRILLDNVDIREFDITSYRELFGIVWQEPFFFNLSIRENLLLVKEEATEEELIKACKLARAWDFIKEFPKGLDTVIGEQALRLSGGQRQRLALARVFLKNPPVIILDEATSQLDSLTEKAIEDAILTMKGSHTIIVIAHRLSTVIKADMMILMNNGIVEDIGTHESLMERSTLYRELYKTFIKAI